ncbi:MAG: recombinase family protein [Bacteroidia bacterium]|nr:recombinase family protein [Bacteroidia bacterium]
MNKESARVGIWIRVSTEEQAKGESPEHHEERARAYAKANGWEITTVYHLEGVSGKSVSDHPEAKRMLADVAHGRITHLIFSKLARLARNTSELLTFSEHFESYNAYLVSLQEKIDTSSPAGRLFYTIIAAMAQWEREEISARVAASVPIRAQLGKTTGGQAPYGYKYVDKKLVIDDNEAPVRKLMFELYAEHKRKKTVARLLNEQGYRTRKGRKFSDSSVDRLLRDPVAKGKRRMNYTKSRGKGLQWDLKDPKEWIIVDSPAIVSEELWDKVNAIMDEQTASRKPRTKKGTHLFTSIVQCSCGHKMYVPSNSPKYICYQCRNKIREEDLEDIFHHHLESFLVTDEQIQVWLSKAIEMITEREDQLNLLQKEYKTLKQKLDTIIDLRVNNHIPENAFQEHYQPVYEQAEQIKTQISLLEGEITALKVQLESSDQVFADAKLFYDQWPQMSFEEKRSFVETVTDSIVIDPEGEIEIILLYSPATTPFFLNSSELMTEWQHTPKD